MTFKEFLRLSEDATIDPAALSKDPQLAAAQKDMSNKVKTAVSNPVNPKPAAQVVDDAAKKAAVQNPAGVAKLLNPPAKSMRAK